MASIRSNTPTLTSPETSPESVRRSDVIDLSSDESDGEYEPEPTNASSPEPESESESESEPDSQQAEAAPEPVSMPEPDSQQAEAAPEPVSMPEPDSQQAEAAPKPKSKPKRPRDDDAAPKPKKQKKTITMRFEEVLSENLKGQLEENRANFTQQIIMSQLRLVLKDGCDFEKISDVVNKIKQAAVVHFPIPEVNKVACNAMATALTFVQPKGQRQLDGLQDRALKLAADYKNVTTRITNKYWDCMKVLYQDFERIGERIKKDPSVDISDPLTFNAIHEFQKTFKELNNGATSKPVLSVADRDILKKWLRESGEKRKVKKTKASPARKAGGTARSAGSAGPA